jgi:hypothetical protein
MRLKKNIKKLDDVLSRTLLLESVKFTWDHEHHKIKFDNRIAVPEAFTGEAIGFIAQDVETVNPEIVWTDDEGFKTLEYGPMVSLGIGSVKEQQKRISNMYDRINRLNKLIRG